MRKSRDVFSSIRIILINENVKNNLSIPALRRKMSRGALNLLDASSVFPWLNSMVTNRVLTGQVWMYIECIYRM